MVILKELIKTTATVPVEKLYHRNVTRLSEPSASSHEVVISGLPDDTLVIKVDHFTAPTTVFNGTKGENKRADFVIISDEKKKMIFIEMKRTKDSPQEIMKQLKGAACFMSYCCAIGKNFWKNQTFLHGYQMRFISMGHVNIPKQATRISKPAIKHDTPENMMKIDWPTRLEYNRLAA